MLKLFGERPDGENEDVEADLDFFLHEQGYNFWESSRLTMVEISLLVRGALQAQERNKG